METNRGEPGMGPDVLSNLDRCSVNNDTVDAAINTKAAKFIVLRLVFSARISLLLSIAILATKRHIRQKTALCVFVPLCGCFLVSRLLTQENRMVSCDRTFTYFSKWGKSDENKAGRPGACCGLVVE